MLNDLAGSVLNTKSKLIHLYQLCSHFLFAFVRAGWGLLKTESSTGASSVRGRGAKESPSPGGQYRGPRNKVPPGMRIKAQSSDLECTVLLSPGRVPEWLPFCTAAFTEGGDPTI